MGDHPKFWLPILFMPRWTCILKYDVFSAASMKYPVQLEDWRSIPVHLFRSRALNLPGNTLSVSKWSLDQNVKSFCWDLSQEQCIISGNFRTTLCPTQLLGSPVRSYMASVPLNIKPVLVVHRIQDEYGWLVACNWQVFSFNPSTNTSLLFCSLSNIFWNILFEVVYNSYTELIDNVLMVNSFATFWAVSLFWRNWILWQAARALEALLARAETKAVEGGAIHVIHSGKPEKEDQTRSPNSNGLLIFPKRPEKQVLGCCIHYELARFMAMRMKMLVFLSSGCS